MSRPSVLITGANGFIGSHLCDAFVEAGYRVFGLVRRTSDLRFLKDSPVDLIYGDLRDIDGITFTESVEVIVHAAALVSDNASKSQCKAQIYDTTVNLAEWAMRRCVRLAKFIYISTALTIGYCADNISEDNPGKPAEYVPYNYMKKMTEGFLLKQFRRSAFPVVVIRPGDVYGPRDRTSCELMLNAAERNVPLIVGRGDKKFGFCYPGNLCKAVLAAVDRPLAVGQAYTVTNAVFPTWSEFFSSLSEGVGKPQRLYVPVSISMAAAIFLELIKFVFPGFKPPVNFYRIRRITTQTTYDLSKTIRDLDYEPDDDYKSQFKAIVDWYMQAKSETPAVDKQDSNS
jgi:nucleoside-diphosphate-sugar epimerase